MNDAVGHAVLSAVPDLGPVTTRRLLAAFGTPEAIFDAPSSQLTRIEGIGQARAERIKAFRGHREIKDTIHRLTQRGVTLLVAGEVGYPEALSSMGDDAPLVLYARGAVQPDDRFAIAIVGSRMASHYGKSITERLGTELASRGFTIVSGLARGIDSAAHRGALSPGGRTIGVLGSGIDVPYPPENLGLMDEIASSGCVISEFPPGMEPHRENFPRRNRLISGLSLGVVVVEAGKRSGALITARYGLEQGKEVFAVPGNISSPVSQGTNALIKDGARLVTHVDDIVEELAPVLKGFLKSSKKRELPAISEDERTLCDIMSEEPMHVDAISEHCGLTASRVLSLLLGLELKGVVRQIEGKRFYLA